MALGARHLSPVRSGGDPDDKDRQVIIGRGYNCNIASRPERFCDVISSYRLGNSNTVQIFRGQILHPHTAEGILPLPVMTVQLVCACRSSLRVRLARP
jgi:hypothetical protein